MPKRSLIPTLTFMLCVTLSPAMADWRENGSGLFPTASPPRQWSASENVRWKTPTPSWSNGGIARRENRLFIGAEPDVLLCIDSESGQIVWQRENPGEITLSSADLIKFEQSATERALHAELSQALSDVRAKIKQAPGATDLLEQEAALLPRLELAAKSIEGVPIVPKAVGSPETGGSTPTPVMDVERNRVYAFFGSGVVAAYDFDGTRLWATALPLGTSKWGHTSSPVTTKHRLIVCHGAVTGLDLDTGRKVWSVPSQACHGSPVLTDIGDTSVVITPSGLCLRTADGGKVCTNLPSLAFNAPIVHKGVVYYMGVDNKLATAYGLPRQTYSPTPALKIWETPLREGRYFASPVLHNGTLFGVRQSGTVVAIDAASGQKLKEQLFDDMHKHFGQCYASLALAGDHLYVFSDNGTVLALDPVPQFKLAHQLKFTRIRGNPLFAGGRIYLRAMQALYCVSAE